MAKTANSPKEKEKERPGSKAGADRVQTGRVEKKLRFPHEGGLSS